jgi:hypothetical protein
MANAPRSIQLILAASSLLLTRCGPSELSKQFSAASRAQSALDTQTLKLWKRSPSVDSGNAAITSKDDLEAIPRTELSFAEASDLSAPIQSADVKIYKSTKELTSPAFLDWAGRAITWKNPEFQVFMGFHHATKAKNLALSILPDVKFSDATTGVLPLTVYALEPGSVGDNHYAPDKNSIFLYFDAKSVWPDYHVVDEADAIYHEFGHAVQDALNPTVLNYPIADFTTPSGGTAPNRDLDALVEGGADFYAAAVARDDVILSYLSAHLPSLIAANDRKGQTYKRSAANSLAFPEAYLRDAHLDGRVISGALNDFRKILEGQTVGDIKLSTGTVARDVAFDRAAALSFRAFAQLTTTSTYFDYAALLESNCTGHASLKSWCGTAEVSAALSKVLATRGLKAVGEVPKNVAIGLGQTVSGVLDVSTPASATPDVTFSDTLAPLPFPNDPGFANADVEVDRCEVLLLFPQFTVSGTSALYDITVELLATTGFTTLKFPGTENPVEESVNTAQAEAKVLGWLKPGESSGTLVNFISGDTSSRWYADAFGSTFTRKLGSSYFPSELGWLVRAPATAGAVATAKFRLTMRRTNSTSIVTQTTAIVTQRLTVNSNTSKPNSYFCP